MPKILYLHGFASSGNSGTAQHLRQKLYPAGIIVLSPDLPEQPLEAMALIRQLVEQEQPDLIVGTSMSGFYAEMLHGWKRILVNPSFQMSRLLTFGGMGRQEWRNKREDGAKDFKIDREMIAQFKELERESFKDITPADRELVWGLFGNKDKKVNHQKDFAKHYGKAQMQVFDGEHYLNDAVMSKTLLPLIQQILGL